MASSGYYDDHSASSYRYGYSQPASPATSFHLCLFLATASLLGAASIYSRCQSAMENLFDQLRIVVVLSPLLLLLAAQYWAATSWRRSRGSGGLTSLLVAPLVGESSWYDQQRDGAGASSPWGVALALALVLLLISYQSCFQDWWFPLISRR